MCSIWSASQLTVHPIQEHESGAASRTLAIASRRFSSGERAAGQSCSRLEPADASGHVLETDLPERLDELFVAELPARVGDDQL